MAKKQIIKILILILILISGYFLMHSMIGNNKFQKLITILQLDEKQRFFIKKYFFPYKLIDQQQQKISDQKVKLSEQKNLINKLGPYLSYLEIDKKESGTPIKLTLGVVKLSNNKTLNKFRLNSGFYDGIHELLPGSGYIDFYNNKILVMSSKGIIAYTDDLNKKKLLQIKNNIDDFININQFKKNRAASIKDILISEKKIFVSYTQEIKNDCWNTSVVYGDIEFKEIYFKELFTSKKCVLALNLHSSGGRMVKFGEDYILLSVGEFLVSHLAQNINNINGKIIKININDNKHEIISMGHRNPQGLFFDKINNFILQTEHGPQGGDEINLIKIDKIDNSKIQNFGWPISSYGEHYGGKNAKSNIENYKKYPLYKSHTEYGFIEPLKSFVPSIAISEIEKIGNNKYVVSSLKNKSLYFFSLDDQKNIIDLKRVEVFERIRDIKFKNKKLYLFLETTPSIGVINLTNL